MKRGIEVPVDVEAGAELVERIIIVTDYVYYEGNEGHPGPRGDCPGCPPEPSELYDIEAKWKDTGMLLTAGEWEMFEDRVTGALEEYLSDSGDDESDRDD